MHNNNPVQATSAVLLILSVSVGVSMVGLGIVWPLIPIYAVELGAGGFLVGMVIASYSISRTIFSPFTGRISDRWGRKTFIAAGLFVYAGISFLYVFSKDATTLVGIRFFHGLASLFVVPIAMALAADIAPKQKLGFYMGTLNMAIMLGLGVGPVLGGVIRDNFGMNAAFYAMGMLALFTCFLVVLFIPPDKISLSETKTRQPAPWKIILRNRTVLGIVVMRFFSACGQGTVYTFLPILAMRLGLTSTQVGIILSVNIFIIAFLQRSAGRLADRINPKHLIVYGTLATGVTVMGMPLASGFQMILFLNIFMGLANGISLPGGLVVTGHLGRKMGMATLMSVTDAAWNMGMIVSPILSGFILDIAGLPDVFIIGSVMILIGGIAVAFFLRDYQMPDPEEQTDEF